MLLVSRPRQLRQHLIDQIHQPGPLLVAAPSQIPRPVLLPIGRDLLPLALLLVQLGRGRLHRLAELPRGILALAQLVQLPLAEGVQLMRIDPALGPFTELVQPVLKPHLLAAVRLARHPLWPLLPLRQ